MYPAATVPSQPHAVPKANPPHPVVSRVLEHLSNDDHVTELVPFAKAARLSGLTLIGIVGKPHLSREVGEILARDLKAPRCPLFGQAADSIRSTFAIEGTECNAARVDLLCAEGKTIPFEDAVQELTTAAQTRWGAGYWVSRWRWQVLETKSRVVVVDDLGDEHGAMAMRIHAGWWSEELKRGAFNIGLVDIADPREYRLVNQVIPSTGIQGLKASDIGF